MKLLYATSMQLPSRLANRTQVLAMSRAFSDALGNRFVLGIVEGNVTDMPVITVPGSSRSPFLAWRYLRLMRAHKITHLYCREERLLVFLMLYAKLMGIRAEFFFEAHFFSTNFFFRTAVKWADGVVAITKGIEEEIRRCSHTKTLVAPDGVSLGRYENLPSVRETRKTREIPQDARVIGYTGSLTLKWKGIDTLLEAARLAPLGWLFWIIGGNPEEAEHLRTMVPANVRIEGHVKSDQIPALQRACDVLVLPNKKGDPASERYTSPLKLFEYLASGIPVAASDLPATREIVSEAEVAFFMPDDAVSLVETLRDIVENSDSAQVRARNARTCVAEYTWERRTARVLDFLRNDR